MSQPYIGEIRSVGFNFAPLDWAFCDGSLQSIANNTALFNLIGTTYGGDGVNTFALPDLRSRAPIHQGTGVGLPTMIIGQIGGTENVTLLTVNLPPHTHSITAEGASGASNSAIGGYFATTGLGNYGTTSNGNSGPYLQTTNSGGNQPHNNIQPLLTINYIISLYGVYPTQG